MVAGRLLWQIIGICELAVPQYIYSDYQKQFQEIQKELEVDVAEPIAKVIRISAATFTNTLDKRRGKVLARTRRNNSTAINRVPPSAPSLFGGDHSQLATTMPGAELGSH